MKEKKYVVGVDLGTTSTKTVIFDFEGNVVGAGQVENPLYYPAPGRQECDGRRTDSCHFRCHPSCSKGC